MKIFTYFFCACDKRHNNKNKFKLNTVANNVRTTKVKHNTTASNSIDNMLPNFMDTN